MREKPDLKPCPFCGNEKIIIRRQSYKACGGLTEWVHIKCNTFCKTVMSGVKESSTIERWNTRAS